MFYIHRKCKIQCLHFKLVFVRFYYFICVYATAGLYVGEKENYHFVHMC